MSNLRLVERTRTAIEAEDAARIINEALDEHAGAHLDEEQVEACVARVITEDVEVQDKLVELFKRAIREVAIEDLIGSV